MEKQEISIIVKAVDKFTKTFSSINGKVSKLTSKLQKHQATFKKMAGFGAVGLTGLGVASINAGKDFDKAFGNISTLVDTSVESIADMKKQVLELGKKSAKPTQELAIALYDIRSAGIVSADAMKVLNSAQKLATAGLSDTSTATDLLTSAFNAFSVQGYNSDQIAQTLFKTVKNGKTTVQQLAQGFGGVASIVQTAGIDFNEFMASVSALTTVGLPASQVYSSLKGVISGLIKPTSDAKKIAKELGIDFSITALKTKGFAGFLKDLKEKTGGNIDVMGKMFGSVEGLGAVLGLTGGQLVAFENALADNLKTTNDLDTAVSKQNETFSAQYQILKNNLQPILIQVFDAIAPILKTVSKWVAKNPELTKTIAIVAIGVTALVTIIGTLGLVIPSIITGIGALGVALSFLALNPIGLVITAIATGIAIGVLIVKNWDTIVEKAKELGNWLVDLYNKYGVVLGPIYLIIEAGKLLYNNFGLIIEKAKELGTNINEIWNTIQEQIVKVSDYIAEYSINKIQSIIDFAKKAIDIVKGIWNKIVSIKNKISSSIGRAVSTVTGARAKGGRVEAGQTYMVGEKGRELFTPNTSGNIIPNDKLGGGDININIGGITVQNESDENRLIDKIKTELTRTLQLQKMGIS